MTQLKPVQAEFTAAETAASVSGNPDRFVNREFSWLQFNRRVLEESHNINHPLLERVRFLSISADNLDEFFMVRVAGLAGQVRQGIKLKSPDGRTPEQQLEHLLREVERLQEDQQKSLSDLMTLLEREGIASIVGSQLAKDEKTWLEEHFQEQIFPVLTPLSIDPAHPFPFIPNLGFSIALQLRHPQGRRDDERAAAPAARAEALHPPARPQGQGALHPAGGGGRALYRQAVSRLRSAGSGTFRIIRDSDIEVEEESEDLVRLFETALKRRRRGSVIRIEFDKSMPEELRDFVAGELGVPATVSACCRGRWRSARFRKSWRWHATT